MTLDTPTISSPEFRAAGRLSERKPDAQIARNRRPRYLNGMELAAALTHLDLDTMTILDVDGRYSVRMARTFDPDIDWRNFNRTFDTDTLPCAAPQVLSDDDTRAQLRSVGAYASLQVLEDLLREGRHQAFTLRVDPKLDLKLGLFIHSSTLGRGNGMHALRAGGMRRHDPLDSELEVFADGCNLARAMSYKNAAAGLPMGGCKFTLQSEPIQTEDLARLGFLAYCIEDGRVLTGPDMGFTPGHVDALREHFTRHCTGGHNGPLGPTAIPTAYGVFLAIREASRHHFGTADLTGRRVALQGVGLVGRALAEHLAAAGAQITVADPDANAIAKLKQVLGSIDVVHPDEVLTTACDILSPCAGGGVLDQDSIAQLQCKVVFGAANNPLKAFSKAGEVDLARQIAARGILFQIEWLHNTAGVMSGFEEYLRGPEATHEHLRPRLERVCKAGTAEVLKAAAEQNITPTEIAYAKIEARLFPQA